MFVFRVQRRTRCSDFRRCCCCSWLRFHDATLTLSQLMSFLFSGGSVLVKVIPLKLFVSLLSSFLTLLPPPSPFQINIQKHLIKNPTPRPPPERDKQIRARVCSLLAHPIHCFNDLTSTPVKEKKEKKCKMVRCSGRMWHKKMKTRHSWGWVRGEVHTRGGGGRISES